MAEETLLPNSIGTDNWTSGAVADIQNGVDTPDDGALYLTTELEGARLSMGFDASGISDNDTVTNVTVRCRAHYGANSNDDFTVTFLITSTPVGSPVAGVLTGSMANQSFNDAAWNADWTAAELDGLVVRLETTQGGMPEATDIDLSEVEVVITYTPVVPSFPYHVTKQVRRAWKTLLTM